MVAYFVRHGRGVRLTLKVCVVAGQGDCGSDGFGMEKGGFEAGQKKKPKP